MKGKVFFVVAAFLLMDRVLEAQENVQFSWDLASVSTGIRLANNANNEANSEFAISVLDFNIGYKDYFIFSFDVAKHYFYFPITRTPEPMITHHKLYFINVDLFSAVLKTENVLFGPFGTVNYLCLSDWEQFEFDTPMSSAGLRLVVQTKAGSAKLPLWFSGAEIETGIRSIKTDFVVYWNWAFTVRYYSKKNRG
jgi:hypothetical protein